MTKQRWRPPKGATRAEWWAWYNAYLRSPAWWRKRASRLTLDGHQCVCCGASERLQVHHLTYKRVGRESINDLRTTCTGCHSGLHERVSERKKQDNTVDAETLRRRKELKQWAPPKPYHGTKIGGVRIVGPFKQDLTTKRRPKPTPPPTTP